jgi:multiple sugar transport system ATP-binding protein
VRPEHFVDAAKADFAFTGEIAVAERLGDHNLLHLNVEDMDEMVAVTNDGNRRVAVGQAYATGRVAYKWHLFRSDGQACDRHYREPALFG